jgi:glycosyltransferase involved in cell wall biosynthesis
MKILLVHNFYRYRGGEDRYVTILEDILTRAGHQVIRFFCDSRDIDGFSLVKKYTIPFKLINSPALNKELETFLLREKPDLAVVHNLAPLLSISILRVLKKHAVPILKRLENYKFLCLNGLFLRNDFTTCEKCKRGNFLPGIVHRCYQRSLINSMGIAVGEWFHRRNKTVIRNTDLFLATSQFLKSKFVEAGFPGDKIEVFPNFIDFEPVKEVSQPGPYEAYAGYAVYLGRLSKEKGLLTLLNAFVGLPQLPLKIVGSGPLENEMKEFVRDHGMENIEFAGFIDGPLKREILASARFLIFPSECYESFGYTIIESYACATPVIASDIGGARELVTEGETGFLFKPGDADDLRRQISLLLVLDNASLMAMKQKSLACANEFFTGEIGYKNLENLLKKVLITAKKIE